MTEEINLIDAENGIVEVVFKRQYTKKQIEAMKAQAIERFDKMLAAS